MTKARDIITGALRFHLNRLSPGETMDDDTAGACLEALNNLADEMNGAKSFLFREVLTTSSAITGTTATLGSTWVGLSPGDEILGATVQYTAGNDVPIALITMQQYQNIPLKNVSTFPQSLAYDGLSTVYLYPGATGQTVTLRTRQIVSDFADLDTDYSMPKGYKAALSAMLAERMAPSIAPAKVESARAEGQSARRRLMAQAVNPAIIGARPVRGNILSGW